MHRNEAAWERFARSGSVDAYLAYKGVENEELPVKGRDAQPDFEPLS